MRSAMRTLTARQLQVLALIAAGHTVEEVSRRLYLAVRTVNTELRDSRNKLGARNRTHTVALAIESGLIRLARADA